MELEQVKEYTEQDMYSIFTHGYMMGLRNLKSIPYATLFGESMRNMIEQKTGLKPAISEDIILTVCKFFDVPYDDVFANNNRQAHLITVVKYSSFLCYWFTNNSLTRIGDLLGRDHSSILHHIRDLTDLSDVDPSVKNTINQIISVIGVDGFYLIKTKRTVKAVFPKWIKY